MNPKLKTAVVSLVALVDHSREILKCLDKQQSYFQSKKPQLLRESKDLERRLRQRCQEMLDAAHGQKTLFVEDEIAELPNVALDVADSIDRIATTGLGLSQDIAGILKIHAWRLRAVVPAECGGVTRQGGCG